MKIRKAIFIIIISIIFFSCSKKNKISPFGYFRIDLPEKNYNYYDLFPEQDIFNMSCELVECDKVTENKLNILTTMKVNF